MMKRISSLLLALAISVCCFSVYSSAFSETVRGTYDSKPFIATNDSYTDYYCAALTSRARTVKSIYNWIEVHEFADYNLHIEEDYYAIEHWEQETDPSVNYIFYQRIPYDNTEFCGFPISDFYIGVTQIAHLYPGVDGPYIPEEAKD